MPLKKNVGSFTSQSRAHATKLYLSYPHMRLNAGFGDVFQRPSRFLQEIPNELLEDWEVKRS